MKVQHCGGIQSIRSPFSKYPTNVALLSRGSYHMWPLVSKPLWWHSRDVYFVGSALFAHGWARHSFSQVRSFTFLAFHARLRSRLFTDSGLVREPECASCICTYRSRLRGSFDNARECYWISVAPAANFRYITLLVGIHFSADFLARQNETGIKRQNVVSIPATSFWQPRLFQQLSSERDSWPGRDDDPRNRNVATRYWMIRT